MSTLWLLLPDFALIALGYGLRHRGRFRDDFWRGAEQLVYYVLFPALLFAAVARAKFEWGSALQLISGTFAVIVAGALMGGAVRRWRGVARIDWASSVQCAFRFNSYIALAAAARLVPDGGVATMAIIVGFAVPLANILAVWPLAKQSGHPFGREMMKNPLILATLGGLSFNLLGGTVPTPIEALLSRLGAAAITLGLICVGASLQWRAVGQARFLAVWMTATKLMALPMVALAASAILNINGQERTLLVLFASLPTASASFILATRMGGNGPLVAGIIAATTLGSALTIPLWMHLAR